MGLEKLRETKKNILNEKERAKKQSQAKEEEKSIILNEFLNTLAVFSNEVKELDDLSIGEAQTLVDAFFEKATRIYDDLGLEHEAVTFGKSVQVLFYTSSLPQIEYYLNYI
jgi:hypothetical protein